MRTQLENSCEFSDAMERGWLEIEQNDTRLNYDIDSFATYLAAKLNGGDIEARSAFSLRLADLYLAAACASGEEAALFWMEHSVLLASRSALVRSGIAQADVDDALQKLREKLFMASEGRRAKILDYNGLGKLSSWTRIAAIRILHNGTRKTHREVQVDSEQIWERILPAGDAQLEFLKERYQTSFRAALACAIENISDRERLLLRQHIVEGVTSTQLGALYQVHRATVSRWILTAQEALLKATRQELMHSLQVTNLELESVLRLIQSRFETGLGDLLAGEG